MADRELNVQVGVTAGQDTLTPQLKQQAVAAEQLGQQLAQTRQAVPPQAIQAVPQAVPQAAPLGPDPEVAAAAERIREQQRQERIRGQARALLAREQGAIPESAIRAVSQPGDAATRALQGLGQATQAAGQGITGLTSMAAGLPGPMGAAAAAAGVVAVAVVALSEKFRFMAPTLEELSRRTAEATTNLNQARSTGQVTAETLRQTLSPRAFAELEQAQRQGNRARQEEILQREQQRAQGRVQQLGAQNPEATRAALTTTLTDALASFRQGGPGRQGVATVANLEVGQIMAQAGMQRADLPRELQAVFGQAGFDFSQMNEDLIRQFSDVVLRPVIQAQATAATTGAALRPGMMPSLRAGAPDVTQLPQLFQSQQGTDFAALRDEIQRESVRDQRQQAQYQAQIELWTSIHRELQRMNGQPGVQNPPAPAVGP